MKLRLEDIDIGKCVGEAHEWNWSDHMWLRDDYRVRHLIVTPMTGASDFINRRLREVLGPQWGSVTNKFVYVVDKRDNTFTAMWSYDDRYFGVINVEVTQ